MARSKTVKKIDSFSDMWEAETKRRKEDRKGGKTCSCCGSVVDVNSEEFCFQCRSCGACCACHY